MEKIKSTDAAEDQTFSHTVLSEALQQHLLNCFFRSQNSPRVIFNQLTDPGWESRLFINQTVKEKFYEVCL